MPRVMSAFALRTTRSVAAASATFQMARDFCRSRSRPAFGFVAKRSCGRTLTLGGKQASDRRVLGRFLGIDSCSYRRPTRREADMYSWIVGRIVKLLYCKVS